MKIATGILIGLFLLAGCAGSKPEFVPVTGEELIQEIRKSPATVKVVNFWASWCIPCQEEFPDLVRLERTYADRGLRVFFVSIDFPEDIPHAEAFLKEQGVGGKTYLKTGKDESFILAIDSTWSGAIPATAIYDARGRKRAFMEGKLKYEQLEQLIQPLLSPNEGA